jgi:hypothetical protein
VSLVTVDIRAADAADPYIEIVGAGVIPRVGDLVEFADGLGRVSVVTWKPTGTRTGPSDIRVLVECVPVSRPTRS